jgi:flagellar hook-basal body complex protein FliE
MISGIESSSAILANSAMTQHLDQVRARQVYNLQKLDGAGSLDAPVSIQPAGTVEPTDRVTFGKLIGELVGEVDAKGRTSENELRRVMTGESDNLHQSMIAMQQASVAFSLMVEVRNKLMESYQQIMRMQV